MTLSILLANQNLVLHMEMRCVVIQIDIFGQNEAADNLVHDFCNESVVSRSRIDSAIIQVLIESVGLIQFINQFLRLIQVLLSDPVHIHILVI